MAIVIDKGSVPPDDPMFGNSPEVFSPLAFKLSSKTSASATTGETQDKSQPSAEEPEDPMLPAAKALEAWGERTFGNSKD